MFDPPSAPSPPSLQAALQPGTDFYRSILILVYTGQRPVRPTLLMQRVVWLSQSQQNCQIILLFPDIRHRAEKFQT